MLQFLRATSGKTFFFASASFRSVCRLCGIAAKIFFRLPIIFLPLSAPFTIGQTGNSLKPHGVCSPPTLGLATFVNFAMHSSAPLFSAKAPNLRPATFRKIFAPQREARQYFPDCVHSNKSNGT